MMNGDRGDVYRRECSNKPDGRTQSNWETYFMTKAELISRLTDEIPSLTKRQVEVVVNIIFDSMRNALTRGDKIEIRGFGSFKLRSRRMKEGRNPKTGESVLVPPKKIPFFKVGKALRHMVHSSPPPHDTCVSNEE